MSYSEIGISIGRIPVAVEVSPVRIGIEPGNLLANLSIGRLIISSLNLFANRLCIS